MIIPSIDLMDGQTVQLVGGEEKALDLGDPLPWAERFSILGEVTVIDLDAALGRGSNRGLIEGLVQRFSCRVGGGIRDAETARRWLDRGAARVILGTAARPEVLRALPPERVIAALDAREGEVVVDGWRTRTGRPIAERMRELEGLTGGFLVTFVEREGRLEGLDLTRVPALVAAAGGARLTVAGGVTGAEEIAALDRLGVDAQVGMAIYTGRLSLAEAFAAPLTSDRPDGLWPTIVADELGGALGLCYSNRESLAEAIHSRQGVYWSRSRGLWRKGETSGQRQDLLRIDADCDRDALRFTVRQLGSGFCHQGSFGCFGPERGLGALWRRLCARAASAPVGSYTRRLLDDPDLLAAKLREEASELAQAQTPDEVTWEAADLLYFALVAMTRREVGLDAVLRELDRRALHITRRSSDAKPGREP